MNSEITQTAQPDNNPLLAETILPVFSLVKPEHIEPAIRYLVAANLDRLEILIANAAEPLWKTVIQPLHEMNDRLEKAWAIASHLNAVVQTDALRAAHDACLPVLSEYNTQLGQHRGLFTIYERIRHSDEFLSLTQGERKALENAMRDFHLSGLDLPPEQQKSYAEITSKLSSLSSRFSNQVLDATKAWSKQIIDRKELAGLPDSAMKLLEAQASARQQPGWLLTLDVPCYLAVMTYADNPALRRELYEAYVTRASECGPQAGQFDNSPVMKEILALRKRLAVMLGYSSYAEYSLVTKMADSPEQVCNFLRDLAKKSRQSAQDDWVQLCEFAKNIYSMDSVQSWDVAWLSERFRQENYSIDKEKLKEYFPVNAVLEGLFAIAKKLFNVSIYRVEDVDLWHKDAQFYRVCRDEETIAFFYLDLYARENKRSGAWMGDCRVRRRMLDGFLQLPIAFLTCNFTPPVGSQPSLLTFDDVTTLFHEFGHGFHHMLTSAECAPVSGINGVAWDAVELPSQWLENWCWEKEVIPLISSHFLTGDALPDILLDKLLGAKHFQSGLQMLRQIEFALFDMKLHCESQQEPQRVLDDVRREVAVTIPPAWNRFQNTFSHIFAGGYAAGYYSYKWAELLSADAFSLFEENGLFDEKTCQSFVVNVLERGGESDAAELFRQFRGRDPDASALLRHNGITDQAVSR